jgi:hypothetical protein
MDIMEHENCRNLVRFGLDQVDSDVLYIYGPRHMRKFLGLYHDSTVGDMDIGTL